MRVILTAFILLGLLTSPLIAGEIHDAAEQGDLDRVKTLLASDDSLLEATMEDGKTALHKATYAGQVEVASFLIESGADVNAMSGAGSTPLHGAAYYGHLEAVRILLANGADVNAANNYNYIPLLSAAGGGRMEVVQLLLESGADVNATVLAGATALMLAAQSGSKETFDLLVAKGLDVNAVDEDGDNLLQYAALGGNVDLIKTALDNGIDVNAKGHQNSTALHYAVGAGQTDGVSFLISQGADLDAINDAQQTPLHQTNFLVREHGAEVVLEIAHILVQAGANTNLRDRGGATPLMGSIHTENTDMLQLLLDNHANIDALDNNGKSPLYQSVITGRTNLVKLLIENGARPDLKNERDGHTVLHAATLRGNKEMVGLLLPAVVNINETDNEGRTALHYAAKYGHKQIAELLEESGATAANLETNYGRSPLLDESLDEGEAVLWYLGHCGWAIKTQNHLLVFDYWDRTPATEPHLANGRINPVEIADQNVEVFVSHEHSDHFDSSIFAWPEQVNNLTYYFGFRPEDIPEENRKGYAGQPYEHFGPRESRDIDGMQIKTIAANDAGVGFLVEVDGVKIYHAGDHAGWRESEKDGFTQEIDYLAEQVSGVDFAFVNVTGCHVQDTVALAESTFYTLEKLSPRILVPTHGADREYVYRDFAEKVAAANFSTPVLCAEVKGDRYIFKNDQIL